MKSREWIARAHAPVTPKPARPQPQPLPPAPAEPYPVPRYGYSFKEAGAYLGVAESTIANMAKDGRLPFFKIGIFRRIRRRDLERFADEATEGPNYRFLVPASIAEYEIAAAECERQARELARTGKVQRDDAVAAQLEQAARAYAHLARFYRWNAGSGEYGPEAMAKRLTEAVA